MSKCVPNSHAQRTLIKSTFLLGLGPLARSNHHTALNSPYQSATQIKCLFALLPPALISSDHNITIYFRAETNLQKLNC